MKRPTTILHVERLEVRDTPAALTPAQVGAAYGFNQITFTGSAGAVAGDGRGQTIAIVDAYNDPYIVNDVNTFDQRYSVNGNQTLYQQYGAASSFLSVVAQQGTRNNGSWAGEIALDVEWAHAIAPGARILLVEARSSSFTDLLAAVNYARSQPNVSTVSMSWGSNEFSGETSATYQSYFTTPAGHTGVTFVAASGDSGAPAIWPSVSTNVLAVGGTRLTVSGSGAYVSETAWGDSGGGPSRYFSKPSYQTAYTGTKRGSPDVAYDADPNTGFSVYNTYDGGWEQIGGTSAGAPQWAALVAIADQGRALAGLGSLNGATQTLPAIYALSSADFHDITNGNNGYAATAGYDLATGRGSPRANLVVRDLVGNTSVTRSIGATATPSVTGGGSIRTAVAGLSAAGSSVNGVDLSGIRVRDFSVSEITDEVPWRRDRQLPDWLTQLARATADPSFDTSSGSDSTTDGETDSSYLTTSS
jgi:subtilase family serine protease